MLTATEINEEGADMTKGGKRAGAGRPKGQATFTLRLPELVRMAAEALGRIGRGEGTQEDIAELMLAANASGKSGYGIVGADEITKAIDYLETQRRELGRDGKWDEADAVEARAEAIKTRYAAVQMG